MKIKIISKANNSIHAEEETLPEFIAQWHPDSEIDPMNIKGFKTLPNHCTKVYDNRNKELIIPAMFRVEKVVEPKQKKK